MTSHSLAQQAMRNILAHIGEDVQREGLAQTPERFERALGEWFAGYEVDPAGLFTSFEAPQHTNMVVVRDIDFTSYCEHHFAPISGTVTIGYLPGSKVVGLSKLVRLVDCFALRLQLQERLTSQIAETLHEQLDCRGVGVLINAKHACMTSRGVRRHGSTTLTSCYLGRFNMSKVRAEFLATVKL